MQAHIILALCALHNFTMEYKATDEPEPNADDLIPNDDEDVEVIAPATQGRGRNNDPMCALQAKITEELFANRD